MSEKAAIEPSGTCVELRIKFPRPTDFHSSELPENEVINIDFTKLPESEQKILKSCLTNIVLDQSGVYR